MKFRSAKIDPSARQIGYKDDLIAENELLKLRLELEYGMDNITPTVDPEIQNQWLKHIYNFEEQSKDAGRIKVYDFLGRPTFRKADELSDDELSTDLHRIFSLMEAKGMVLDCNGEYEKGLIYRFITEELFEHEMENVSINGMITHFIYEEFHPNHEQDLMKYTEELVGVLFRKKWDRFDSHCFASNVVFKGVGYDNDTIAAIIQTFQEAHRSFAVEQFEFQDVSFSLEEQHAEVQGHIRYQALGNGNRTHGGTCKVSFTFQWGFWYISGLRFPGFGD